jgi:hypothetical protein
MNMAKVTATGPGDPRIVSDHIGACREHVKKIGSDLEGGGPAERDQAARHLAEMRSLHGDISALLTRHDAQTARAGKGRLA